MWLYRVMRKYLLPILPWLLCCWSVPGISQPRTAVRIGVAILRTSARDVNVTEARDRIVKKLNQLKTDAKKTISIRAVALDSSQTAEALGEATEKNCQYVLISHLTDLLTVERIVPSVDLQTLDQHVIVNIAKVEYEIYRVDARTRYAHGREDGEGSSSHGAAVRRTMELIAHDVVRDLAPAPFTTRPPVVQQPQRELEVVPHMTWVGQDQCGWLAGNLPHRDALYRTCGFALSLKEKMPNFICDQDTSRYLSDDGVPRDLVSALLHYHDGEESLSGIKVNGKPVSDARAHALGLWSTGQFGGDLRAIFDSENNAVFRYVGEKQAGTHRVWIFQYHIAKQNDPLWVLSGPDGQIAPPYAGELWLDQDTGAVVRFRSVAQSIPLSFSMESAELAIDYESVNFGDGTEFVLPVHSMIATTYRGEEAARNIMKFGNCHKFRAEVRLVLGASVDGEGANEPNRSPDMVVSELERNQEIYDIFREEAIREDAAQVELEHTQDLNAATVSALWRVDSLEKERQRNSLLVGKASPAPASKEETSPTYRVSTNLVLVTVVLRNARGEAIGGLSKTDFNLWDNRKPQPIKSFSVENSGRTAVEAGSHTVLSASASPGSRASAGSDNNVAYVFDDLHATFEDLAKVKLAAGKYFSKLAPGEQAAVFTTSGQIATDFTTDAKVLHASLQRLKPAAHGDPESCPVMDYFEADLIVNQNDGNALDLATQDALACLFQGAGKPDGPELNIAARTAMAKAYELATDGRAETQTTLQVLNDVISRMAMRSGRRNVVLVSPGFLTVAGDSQEKAMALIERAVQSGIVINTLDVTGLPAVGGAQNDSHLAEPEWLQLLNQKTLAEVGVLTDFSRGTGGTFFHNNNDLNQGFVRTAEVPEYVYVLGFSPQKLDGKFHKLKVTLKSPEKLNVQARPGYYAGKTRE